MNLKLCLVLEVLLVFRGLTTPQRIVTPFCFEGDCYIRPDYNRTSWADAQVLCRKHNSTLPIVDNLARQKSVVAALEHFNLRGTANAWLGANASDYGAGNWRWLDGSQYNDTVVRDDGSYSKSYAILSKNATKVVAYASAPINSLSYICQHSKINAEVCANGSGRLAFVEESRCFVKHSEKLPWFKARNNCLTNNGDLASFTNISLLDNLLETDECWAGLRRRQWNWKNAVTGLSSNVTFTSWSSYQPDAPTLACISVDYADFPNWNDWNCALQEQYICQVFNITPITSTETPPTSASMTTATVQTQTSGSQGNATISSGSLSEKTDHRLAMGLGIGLGLGSALILAFVIVIIVVVVRRKHQNKNDSSGKSGSEETTAEHNGKNNQEEVETTEMNESVDASALYAQVQKVKGSQPKFQISSSQGRSDDPSTHYATVKEATGQGSESPATQFSSNQGPVYADLGFGQSCT